RPRALIIATGSSMTCAKWTTEPAPLVDRTERAGQNCRSSPDAARFAFVVHGYISCANICERGYSAHLRARGRAPSVTRLYPQENISSPQYVQRLSAAPTRNECRHRRGVRLLWLLCDDPFPNRIEHDSAVLCRLSFCIRFARWVSTVDSPTLSCVATSLLERHSASSWRTSFSRSVSKSKESVWPRACSRRTYDARRLIELPRPRGHLDPIELRHPNVKDEET